eukprot:gene15163-17940_t
MHGDAFRIRQIMLNLLSNSIKFTQKGEVTVRIELLQTDPEAMCTKRTVRLTIQDTGIGMGEACVLNLFKRFTKAENNNPHCSSVQRLGSSGLGLAITLQLVELMGGTIEKPVRDTPLFNCLSYLQRLSDNWMAQKGRILVVEDCSTTQMVTRKILESNGYTVDVAENGLEAMKALYSSPYMLCIVDAAMPVKDGLQTTIQMRELEDAETLPIIAVSTSAKSCQLLMDNGANDFFVKPLNTCDLLASGTDFRILAVDDNPINQKVLLQMLRVLGYKDVVTCNNGKLGVKAVSDAYHEGKPFTFIFMDH